VPSLYVVCGNSELSRFFASDFSRARSLRAGGAAHNYWIARRVHAARNACGGKIAHATLRERAFPDGFERLV
jgi:hypothetical protein